MDDDGLIWRRLGSEDGPQIPLFDVRIDIMRHPESAYIHRCLVLECPDWVNIVARRTDGRVVMVEQYRYGAGAVSLEPPAGIIDPGERPREAAERELLEETGYGGGHWYYLGAVQPNPAFQSNLCHHWLADEVESLAAPAPDPGEAIRVRLLTAAELREEFNEGRLCHTLAISALSRVFPLWEPPLLIDEPGRSS